MTGPVRPMSAPGWRPFGEPVGPAWDAFAAAHPHGRFIHLTGFKKTVEDVYGLRPNYWLFEEDGRLRAIFPSFFHRGILYGKRLVSQPFSEYGGILFSPDAAAAERRAILAEFPRVIQRSREAGRLDYLEVRGFPDNEGADAGLFEKVSLYECAVLPLAPGFKLWDNVNYSVRKNVRRARSCGLTISLLRTPEEIRAIFYPLHLRSLKRLGSPPHPLAYFLGLQQNLGSHLRLSTAWLGRTPIAALLGWVVGASVQITDIASDERFFQYRATDLLHFELIDGAVSEGLRLFDFGPLRYAGQKQYKKKWGVQTREYAYYYSPPQKRRPPLSDRTLPARAARSIWRHVPSALASRLGRLLRKELSI
jgi:CelD/BcsL family acetyltransferase involved in cellulose biosynthesis